MINFLAMTILFTIALAGSLIVLGVWLWALIDCLKSDNDITEKILWVAVIIILNIVGAIIYFLLRNSLTIDPDKKSSGKKKRRLERSTKNRILGGVCGGLGEYFNIDATIIRLLWVVITIISMGTGLLLYLIALVIIPSDTPRQNNKQNTSPVTVIVISAAVVLLVLILSLLLISIIALSSMDSRTISHGTVIDRGSRAEMMVIDRIKSNPSYAHEQEIFCERIEEVDQDLCGRMRDPYGVLMSESCHNVSCNFIDGKNTGITVEAIVSDDRVKKLSFTKLKLGNLQNNETLETNFESINNSVVKVIDINCIDMCGDGVCQEMTCLGNDCPCAETRASCPSDCP